MTHKLFAIVSRDNGKGKIPEVGMNDRMVVSDLETEKGIFNRAREFADGKQFRVEFYSHSHATKPYRVVLESAPVRPLGVVP